MDCGDQHKVHVLVPSWLKNNPTGDQENQMDTLIIKDSKGNVSSMFKRPVSDRALDDNSKLTDFGRNLAVVGGTILFVGSVGILMAATTSELFTMSVAEESTIWRKTIDFLNQPKGGYKANIGQIITREEVGSSIGFALAIPIGYTLAKTAYSLSIEAQTTQNYERICRGDYSSFVKKNWVSVNK